MGKSSAGQHQKGKRVFRGYGPGSSLVGLHCGGSADCDRAVPQVLQRHPPPLLVRAKANQPVECPPTSHAPLLEVGRFWEPFSSRFTLLRSQTPSPCPGSSSRPRHLTFAALRVPRATAAAPRGTKAQGSESLAVQRSYRIPKSLGKVVQNRRGHNLGS